MIRGDKRTQRRDKRYPHRRGHVIEARVDIAPIVDEHGDVVQLFAQIQDVTKTCSSPVASPRRSSIRSSSTPSSARGC